MMLKNGLTHVTTIKMIKGKNNRSEQKNNWSFSS